MNHTIKFVNFFLGLLKRNDTCMLHYNKLIHIIRFEL